MSHAKAQSFEKKGIFIVVGVRTEMIMTGRDKLKTLCFCDLCERKKGSEFDG